jgi:hypothetical protein
MNEMMEVVGRRAGQWRNEKTKMGEQARCHVDGL